MVNQISLERSMTCNIENQFCVMLFNLWLSKFSTGKFNGECELSCPRNGFPQGEVTLLAKDSQQTYLSKSYLFLISRSKENWI